MMRGFAPEKTRGGFLSYGKNEMKKRVGVWSGVQKVAPAVWALLLSGGSALAADLYIAPDGSDSAGNGTIGSPYETITKAQNMASSGDTVYLRGGTYYLDTDDITYTYSAWQSVNRITKDGISYIAYEDEAPVFDFSGVLPDGYRVTAFLIEADNCVFADFEVVGVQVTIDDTRTQSECFRIYGGDNNRFERLSMHDGMGIGWYLTRGGGNLVINCDAYNNKGLNSYSHGNVDGFGAHTDKTYNTGNKFIGCRAWFNSDDGFDLINNDAAVTISNCWSMYNGYDFESPSSKIGDSTGFKAGGYGVSGVDYPTPVPRNRVISCLSVGNSRGFYANHHTGGIDWIGNTAINNGANYNMLCNLDASSYDTDVDGFDQYMKNNLGYGGGSEVINLGSTNENDVTYNYWTLPVSVTAADFESLTYSELTQARQTDGSLPEVEYAHLVEGSDLIDAGTGNLNFTMGFSGDAPDLGAFEYVEGVYPSGSASLAPSADTELRYSADQNGDGSRNYGTNTTMYIRQHDTAPRDQVAYIRFDLASIPSPIRSASFTITRESGDLVSSNRFRVLGLNAGASNTAQGWGETSLTWNTLGDEVDVSFYSAATNPVAGLSPFGDASVTDFEEGIAGVSETVTDSTGAISGDALAAWLEARRLDDGLATLIVDYPSVGDGGSGGITYWSREGDVPPELKILYGAGPTSNPVINRVSTFGSVVFLTWSSDTNGVYCIENKTNLMQIGWTVVDGAEDLTGGISNNTVVQMGSDAAFYRIRGE